MMICKNCGCDPELESLIFGDGFHKVELSPSGVFRIYDFGDNIQRHLEHCLNLDKGDAEKLARWIIAHLEE